MAVVLIIAIMSAAIMGEMHGTFADALLRATSRELIGAMDVASSRAVSVNRPHRLRLDQTAHRFVLERSARGGLDFLPVRDLPGSQGPLDARLTILIRPPQAAPADDEEKQPADEETDPTPADAANSIAFYPDGTADACEIVLTDRDGFSLALRVNPVNSRVELVKMERE